MKFLLNEKSFARWNREVMKGQSVPVTPPKSYPCYGYLVVSSWGYEENDALYLYPRDIVKMNAQIGNLPK